MNTKWIDASHDSMLHMNARDNSNLKMVRVLDSVGMFETSWMIFNHVTNRYGYPSNIL